MGAGQHGRPGAALTDVRQAFARLIEQGVSNSETCREVGINRRTGTRWRYGRDLPASGGRTLHYPPVVTTKRTTPISARFLSEDERITIADLRRTGATVRAIAVELDRSPSTISREVRRNADPAGRYRPRRRIGQPRSDEPAAEHAGSTHADEQMQWQVTSVCVSLHKDSGFVEQLGLSQRLTTMLTR